MRLHTLLILAVLASPLAACATLADAATGDRDLPNAGAGPFREMRKGELGLSLVAPNVVDDQNTRARSASVIDPDADPGTRPVIGYFAASVNGADIDAPSVAIRRSTAEDGRSFVRQSTIVLEATEPWENGTVSAPSALAVSEGVWLFYGAGGGIGLAKSGDGAMFVKEPGPVLGPSTSGWDAGAIPASPSVIALREGGLAMFYEAVTATGKRAIGEARSSDGVVWTRVAGGPVLEAGPSGEEAYDDAGVGAPCALIDETALGEPILRLYYAAESSADKRTIGLAGRYEDGPFDRAESPVFGAGTSRAPGEPSVIFVENAMLLFVTQHRTTSDEGPAIAGGVAPAQAELSPPVTGN